MGFAKIREIAEKSDYACGLFNTIIGTFQL